MSKIATLQAGLNRVAGRNVAPAPSPQPEQKEIASVPTPPAPKAASREGKVHIGAYLPSDFKKSMRSVQAQTGEDLQTMLARALNDLFRSHNVPVVDPNS